MWPVWEKLLVGGTRKGSVGVKGWDWDHSPHGWWWLNGDCPSWASLGSDRWSLGTRDGPKEHELRWNEGNNGVPAWKEENLNSQTVARMRSKIGILTSLSSKRLADTSSFLLYWKEMNRWPMSNSFEGVRTEQLLNTYIMCIPQNACSV